MSIGQYACITANMYAVLIPNRSMPSAASRAPIICQCRCSISPEAPRVVIPSQSLILSPAMATPIATFTIDQALQKVQQPRGISACSQKANFRDSTNR